MSRYFALKQSNHPKMGAWAHIFQHAAFHRGSTNSVKCGRYDTSGFSLWSIRSSYTHESLLYTSTLYVSLLTTFIYKSILDLKGKIQIEDFLSEKARGRDEGDLRWISQDRHQVDGNGFAVHLV